MENKTAKTKKIPMGEKIKEDCNMRKVTLLLFLIGTFVVMAGCNSEYERTMERQRKMSGDWEKDISKWKKAQEKPTKPLWERKDKENGQ